MFKLIITFDACDFCNVLNSFDFRDKLLGTTYLPNMGSDYLDKLKDYGYLGKNNHLLNIATYLDFSDILYAVMELSRNLSCCQNPVQVIVLNHEEEPILTANF